MTLGPSAPRGQSAHRAPRLPVLARQRLYDHLRGSPTGLVALALVVGAGAGLGAIVFRYLILGFTVDFSGQQDYSADGRAPHPHRGDPDHVALPDVSAAGRAHDPAAEVPSLRRLARQVRRGRRAGRVRRVS